ncbi:tagatose-bisphosphate aldolase, partial [Chloroflexota bacterium]
SGGMGFKLFCQAVEIACRNGASGFLGGRAVWQEAMDIKDTKERVQYISTIGADRMKKLSEIASKYGVPWHKKLNLTAAELTLTSINWYREY